MRAIIVVVLLSISGYALWKVGKHTSIRSIVPALFGTIAMILGIVALWDNPIAMILFVSIITTGLMIAILVPQAKGVFGVFVVAIALMSLTASYPDIMGTAVFGEWWPTVRARAEEIGQAASPAMEGFTSMQESLGRGWTCLSSPMECYDMFDARGEVEKEYQALRLSRPDPIGLGRVGNVAEMDEDSTVFSSTFEIENRLSHDDYINPPVIRELRMKPKDVEFIGRPDADIAATGGNIVGPHCDDTDDVTDDYPCHIESLNPGVMHQYQVEFSREHFNDPYHLVPLWLDEAEDVLSSIIGSDRVRRMENEIDDRIDEAEDKKDKIDVVTDTIKEVIGEVDSGLADSVASETGGALDDIIDDLDEREIPRVSIDVAENSMRRLLRREDLDDLADDLDVLDLLWRGQVQPGDQLRYGIDANYVVNTSSLLEVEIIDSSRFMELSERGDLEFHQPISRFEWGPVEIGMAASRQQPIRGGESIPLILTLRNQDDGQMKSLEDISITTSDDEWLEGLDECDFAKKYDDKFDDLGWFGLQPRGSEYDSLTMSCTIDVNEPTEITETRDLRVDMSYIYKMETTDVIEVLYS